MSISVQEKYHWNENSYTWERTDRVQKYNGCIIETVKYHDDSHTYYGRFYRVTWFDGHVSSFPINKRGDNIKSLKLYIDFKVKNGGVKHEN